VKQRAEREIEMIGDISKKERNLRNEEENKMKRHKQQKNYENKKERKQN
jgi:hypothetical protein